MSKEITVAQTILTDPTTAPAEIDRVLNTMIYESRPVYIGVPTDLSYSPVPDEALKTPLVTKLPKEEDTAIEAVVSEIRGRLEKAEMPILMIDGSRFQLAISGFKYSSLIP
jgi:pyruvate decarboxylase